MFFPAQFHRAYLSKLYSPRTPRLSVPRPASSSTFRTQLLKWAVGFFLLIQLLLPWRYVLYPGELFWHEQGFRFSWRVMLMEKQGYTTLLCVDTNTGERWQVQNDQFLTPFQEKQMAFQPDFILEYAHHVAQHYERSEAREHVEVYAQSFVALNGRASQRFVNPNIDLTTRERGLQTIDWLLPFNDTIYGL